MTQRVTQTMVQPVTQTVTKQWSNNDLSLIRSDTTRAELQRTHSAPLVAKVGRVCVGLGTMLLLGVGGLWAALALLDAVNRNGLLAVALSLVIVVVHVPLVLLVHSRPHVSIQVHQHVHLHGASQLEVDR